MRRVCGVFVRGDVVSVVCVVGVVVVGCLCGWV